MRLEFLDNLRAIAIIMVVGVHAAAYISDLNNIQRELISYFLHSVCVPIFFLVDGFLFAKSRDAKPEFDYWDYINKSVKRLLVPWLIFTIGYALIRFAFEKLNFFDNNLIRGKPLEFIAISAYGAVYAAQLYFLMSLFMIRLLAPLIVQLIIKANAVQWTLIYLIFVGIYRFFAKDVQDFFYIQGGQEPISHAFWGLQYYLFGIVMYKLFSYVNTILLLASAGMTTLIHLYGIGNFPFDAYEPMRMIYMISIFSLCYLLGNHLKFLTPIGHQTMGIYLLHVPLVLKILSIVIEKLNFSPSLKFFALLVTGFLASYILTLTINKIGLGSILFGNPKK